MSQRTNSCPDCGEYPVHHPSARFMALADTIFIPVLMAAETIAKPVKPFFVRHLPDGAALPAYRLLAALKIGTLHDDVDELDSGRNRWLWDAAKRRGITLHQFRFLGRPDGMNFFVAERDGKIVAFEGLPRPNRGVSKSLEWMDNKAILKKKFTAAGIPMARGRACRTYAQALATMREVGEPVITKPHIGSRSRHSTIGISTPEALRVGFDRAKQLSPWVVVEQELRGYLFRVLLIEGKIVGVIRREQAHIVGDGATTIRELVARENKNPKRQGPTFHLIPVDDDTELKRAGKTWDSVPERGEIVNLNPHISRWYGGSTSNFTERVHPENRELFAHVADVLGDSLVGIDFIIGDMERSWRDQERCGVIECNSLPNIDLHHEVLYGDDQDMGGLLLDIAFKK